MKIRKFVIFLLLIISFYLAIGKVVEEEESDCDKILPYIRDKIENCCNITKVECDNERYINSIGM